MRWTTFGEGESRYGANVVRGAMLLRGAALGGRTLRAPEHSCWDFSLTDPRDRTGGGHGARSKLAHPSLAVRTAT